MPILPHYKNIWNSNMRHDTEPVYKNHMLYYQISDNVHLGVSDKGDYDDEGFLIRIGEEPGKGAAIGVLKTADALRLANHIINTINKQFDEQVKVEDRPGPIL
jgi:hypothetical protein